MEENKRMIQKKITRAKIIRVAESQFAARGFLVATTDIAKEAGLSHGALFVHFATREELVDTVIEQFFDQLNVQIHIAVKGQKSITDVLNRHLDIIEEHEAFYQSLVRDMVFLPVHTQEKLFACQSVLSFHFQTVLEEERTQQKVKDVPQHMLFNMWIAVIHYYLVNSRMFQCEGSVIRHYREELIDSYLKMIERTDER